MAEPVPDYDLSSSDTRRTWTWTVEPGVEPGTEFVVAITNTLDSFVQGTQRAIDALQVAAEAFAAIADLATFEPVSSEARERARAYLVAHLTSEQRETFEQKRFFHVQGKRYRWRITPYVYGVHRLGRSGRCRGVYCAAPQKHLPIWDVMLAQKLMLETDEDRFLAIANHHSNYKKFT